MTDLLYDPAAWRLGIEGDHHYAFGPILLHMPLPEKSAAYFQHMIGTEKLGMYWSDIEAMEYVPVAIPETIKQLNRTVQNAYRAALRKRFGSAITDMGKPLVGVVARGCWKDRPVTTISAASCTITAFLHAINTGFTADERARCQRITGEQWLVRDLEKLPHMHAEWRCKDFTHVTYVGARSKDRHWRYLKLFATSMGGDACIWPAMGPSRPGGKSFDASINITHHPWLTKAQRKARQAQHV